MERGEWDLSNITEMETNMLIVIFLYFYKLYIYNIMEITNMLFHSSG